jgi:CDP-glucose 4,6-dehydratase
LPFSKVLVTGSNGFFGSWVCESLIKRGYKVVGLDRDHRHGSRIHQFLDQMDLITGDIVDYDLVLRVLNEYEIEFVYHLAAQALVGVAATNPLSTFKSNIEGTWNILEAARVLRLSSNRLAGVIVASSDKAYGDQEQLPYSEEFPMQGRFPYDVSKSCADLIARSYFSSYALPVCVTRCGNLYGGGDLNFSRIVPGTIRSALQNERPLIRSDGTPVRDYLYAEDGAEAFVTLSERMVEDRSLHGMAFNISNEKPVSVLEIVSSILRLANKQSLEPIVEAVATREIQTQYLDATRSKNLLKWHPRFGLDEGLAETIAWYREQGVR